GHYPQQESFPNALSAVIMWYELQVGVLFTGAVLTETIFSWPGIGKWLIDGISRRDYPVLQGGTLLIGTIIMTVNLLVDLTYGAINPRIRHAQVRQSRRSSRLNPRNRQVPWSNSGSTSPKIAVLLSASGPLLR